MREPPFGKVYRDHASTLYAAGVSGRAWAVYVALSTRRQTGRTCARVGLNVVAQDLGGVSERTVRRAVKELVAAGVVEVKRTGRTNVYTIAPPGDNPGE